jgi:Family of unknown function (DUF6346)
MVDNPSGVQRSAGTRITSEFDRRGPILGRLYEWGYAVVLIVAWLLVGLAATTGTSFYRGTGSVTRGSELPAVAHVGDCTREGPASGGRLGYWWQCQVVVHVSDGRVVNVVLDGSKVTPRDTGRPVEFREACSDSQKRHCQYGRPVGFVWAVVVKLVKMFHTALAVGLLVLAAGHVIIGTVGPRRFFAVHRRIFSK